ncbi:hypothetical protein E2C01_097611 [Portunus trituberculatus]|uniref:Uncharacterized protein n=1 Tax=Portunus trituberculatus TaxID=210409 RepID=A0A5B7K5A6_PORTR|nr:hypothetical protein [Portunus trituberculatus]
MGEGGALRREAEKGLEERRQKGWTVAGWQGDTNLAELSDGESKTDLIIEGVDDAWLGRGGDGRREEQRMGVRESEWEEQAATILVGRRGSTKTDGQCRAVEREINSSSCLFQGNHVASNCILLVRSRMTGDASIAFASTAAVFPTDALNHFSSMTLFIISSAYYLVIFYSFRNLCVGLK